MTPEPLSKGLKQAIRDSGLSLYAIAKETGIVRESLSRFVRGQQSLRLDMADKLAAYFGLVLVKKGS